MSRLINTRMTFASAIHRAQEFVRSKSFHIADSTELEHRKKHLEQNFASFAETHDKIVKEVTREDFAWEDEFFAKTDEIYTQVIIEFNRRMKKVEAEELMARLDGQAVKVKRIPIPTPILEFGREKDRNRILFADGTVRFLPLNKRAFIEISSDDEEEVEEKSDVSEKHTVPSKIVKVDLREKIEEKTARLDEIAKEMKQKENEIKRRGGKESDGNKRQIVCNNCGGDHKMYKCEAFLQLSRCERWRRVRAVHVCPNCFMTIFERKHFCREGPCYCGQRHNSLLCDK